MQVELDCQKGQITARLVGELDHHGAGEIRETIDKAVLRCHARRLWLDFSGLSFMDSSGIGLILGRYRLLRSMGGDIRVIGASPRLERMIRLAGLDKLPIWEKSEGGIPHETCQ